MPLADQLDSIRAGAEKRIPPERFAIMLRATADLRASGIVDHAIKPGQRLPDFALANTRGETVRAADLLARGPLVLTVYRGGW